MHFPCQKHPTSQSCTCPASIPQPDASGHMPRITAADYSMLWGS